MLYEKFVQFVSSIVLVSFCELKISPLMNAFIIYPIKYDVFSPEILPDVHTVLLTKDLPL